MGVELRGCPVASIHRAAEKEGVLGNLEVIEEGRDVKPQPLLRLSVCLESAALCCSEITERGFVQRPARRLHRPQRGSGKAAAEYRLGLSWPQRLGCRCPLSLPAWRLFLFVLRWRRGCASLVCSRPHYCLTTPSTPLRTRPGSPLRKRARLR